MSQEHQQQGENPVPIIDPGRCSGCGLCVQVCPTGTLAMKDSIVTVAQPDTCVYTGDCVRICRQQAIDRRFQIVYVPEEDS